MKREEGKNTTQAEKQADAMAGMASADKITPDTRAKVAVLNCERPRC